MPKRSRIKEQDFAQNARRVAEAAINAPLVVAKVDVDVPASEISRVMSMLGRAGGLKGGKRRLETMTAEQRSEAAHRAARARWDKAALLGKKKR